MTKQELERNITSSFLQNNANLSLKPSEIEEQILNNLKSEIILHNDTCHKSDKWKLPQTLSPQQIADVLNAIYPICKISCSDQASEYDLLSMYCDSGQNKGIYITDLQEFYKLAKQFNYSLNKRDFEEIIFCLKSIVPSKKRTMDKNLIAVNNGIFDYETKELLGFDPKYIFLSKSFVNYNPNAINPIIDENGEIWDVESWMGSLSDDIEIVNLLWEILGAIIRPNTDWNKSAWLYSKTGNNGKGTLCELMRNLVGNNAYSSISIADFSKDFMLEPLTHSSAIIVDENDVGAYIDKAANLKACITGDVLWINRKFKDPIAYQFKGFMVQCLNEFPRVKDTTNSFYRRQIFIPMNKNFAGVEKTYIKSDYLHRPEVLEYVLYKILNTNYYTLSEPKATQVLIEEYKEFNNPVKLFFNEFKYKFVWDLLPTNFLYDLYKKWYPQNVSDRGSCQAKLSFISDLREIIQSDTEWTMLDKTQQIKTGLKMQDFEPLIIEYDLKNFMSPHYTGNIPEKQADFKRADHYRGCLVRN